MLAVWLAEGDGWERGRLGSACVCVGKRRGGMCVIVSVCVIGWVGVGVHVCVCVCRCMCAGEGGLRMGVGEVT